jgi:hypothetical protein
MSEGRSAAGIHRRDAEKEEKRRGFNHNALQRARRGENTKFTKDHKGKREKGRGKREEGKEKRFTTTLFSAPEGVRTRRARRFFGREGRKEKRI